MLFSYPTNGREPQWETLTKELFLLHVLFFFAFGVVFIPSPTVARRADLHFTMNRCVRKSSDLASYRTVYATRLRVSTIQVNSSFLPIRERNWALYGERYGYQR